MNIAIDIGNSFIKIGTFEDKQLVSVDKYPSHTRSTKECKDILSKYNYDNIFISSVVPVLTKNFVKASDIEPKILTVNTSPLPIKYPSIGADIIAFSCFVAQNYELPATIFSLGTATTCVNISENKEITGGLIMPGIYSGLRGVVESASALPEVTLEPAKNFLTFNTKEALNNGVFYQTIATVDWLANKNNTKTNIITGGGVNLVGNYIQEKLDREFICDEFLVLKGLELIFG